MKKFLSVLLAMCLIIGAVPMSAFAADSDFVIEGGVLKKYHGPGGDVVIPDGVTSIGEFAFTNSFNLNSVTIPDSVTKVAQRAFWNCRDLGAVSFPDGLVEIGTQAFELCTSLTSVSFPDSLIKIGSSAFKECSSLTDIVIPDSVTQIGNDAFACCSNLVSVTLSDNITTIPEGAFWGCINLPDVTIPDGVTAIERDSFRKCEALIEITIPNGVTHIGYDAFSGCNSLSSITIPDNVKEIQPRAFTASANLKEICVSPGNSFYAEKDGVLFTNDMKTLLQYPMGKSEKSYTIPNGVKIIGTDAFPSHNKNLTSIIIPEGVITIGEGSFSGLNLTSVNLPNSITTIGGGAFSSCELLNDVTIPDRVTTIESNTFGGCSSFSNIIIPDNVTSIGNSAFGHCTNLISITIPNKVTTIEYAAFDECGKLKDVYYGGTEKQWQKIAIEGRNECLTDATVHFTDNPTPPNPPTPSTDFTDVKPTAYYANAVKWAVEKDITSGIGGGKFAPENTCKREQIVTFLYRAKGSPAVTVTDSFTDMPKNQEFQKAISWAVEKGVTSGVGGGRFAPGKGCTRAEAMTFIWRAAGRPEPVSEASFADMPANSDFRKAISWAYENRITSGIGDGTRFGPNQTCTRGQIVTFMYNARDIF